MRTTTGSVHSQFPQKPVTPNYSPSVPLSVYRELAAELQASQAKLAALNLKNQQITQENQHLRQEIAKVVQACLHLQKLLDDHHQPTSQADNRSVNPPDRPNYQADTYVINQPHQESNTRPVDQPHDQLDSPPVAEVKRMKKPPVTMVSPRPKVSRPRPPAKASAPKKIRREEYYVPVVDVDFPMAEPIFIEEEEVRYYTTLESEPKELSGLWLIIFIVVIIITGFAAGYLIVRPLFAHSSR